jgi:hypothetical protein
MVQKYSKGVEQRRLAAEAMAKLLANDQATEPCQTEQDLTLSDAKNPCAAGVSLISEKPRQGSYRSLRALQKFVSARPWPRPVECQGSSRQC